MKTVDHVFSCMGEIRKSLGNKFIYLFLDYDGTLSPIVGNPVNAVMPDRTKNLLFRLSKMPGCKIAIVSGRSLKDISGKIGLKNIVYVGNHGFEIKGPKIKFKSPIPYRYKKILKEIKARLKKDLAPFRGVIVEDKGFCLTVHYRLANKKDIPTIASKFYFATFIDEFRNNISIGSGKMMREIRPPILWNKGMAVLWLLDRQSSAMKPKKADIFPVYIGDDTTDEDAFQSLKDNGITIFVGRPKNTKARFYLKDAEEVASFLEKVLKVRAGI